MMISPSMKIIATMSLPRAENSVLDSAHQDGERNPHKDDNTSGEHNNHIYIYSSPQANILMNLIDCFKGNFDISFVILVFTWLCGNIHGIYILHHA